MLLLLRGFKGTRAECESCLLHHRGIWKSLQTCLPHDLAPQAGGWLPSKARIFIFVTFGSAPQPPARTWVSEYLLSHPLTTHVPMSSVVGGKRTPGVFLWHFSCASFCRHRRVWEWPLQRGLRPRVHQHPGELQMHLLWRLHAGTWRTQLPGWATQLCPAHWAHPASFSTPAGNIAGSGNAYPLLVPWVEKTPWRRKWQPIPVFLPGKSHG